jgi:hypothetical protein
MQWSLFRGIKRPGRGVNHPPPYGAKVEEKVEVYVCSPSGSSWLVGRANIGFYIYLIWSYIVDI